MHQQAGRPLSPMQQMKVSLLGEIAKIQRAAADCRTRVYELGVFIFFSMENGDAWVLEITDCDAVRVAAAGQPLRPPVSEDSERIEVDWSHGFALQERKFFLTDYKDGTETEVAAAPTPQISAAMRRIIRQYPPELLNRVHLRNEEKFPSA